MGTKLLFHTLGGSYTIEIKRNGVYISGNDKYCKQPTRAKIFSISGPNFIQIGQPFNYYLEGNGEDGNAFSAPTVTKFEIIE